MKEAPTMSAILWFMAYIKVKKLSGMAGWNIAPPQCNFVVVRGTFWEWLWTLSRNVFAQLCISCPISIPICNFNPSICKLWVYLSALPMCTHVSRTRQTILLLCSSLSLTAAKRFNEFRFDSHSEDPLLDEQLLPLQSKSLIPCTNYSSDVLPTP